MRPPLPRPPPLPSAIGEVVLHGLADRCAHLVLHAVVDLRGPIDEARARRAAAELVEAFPVLGCRYQPGWWRDHWVRWAGEPADRVTVERGVDDLEAATARCVRRSFDHRIEPPWALALLEHDGGARLVLSAHHMVADGGGIKAMLGVLGARLYGVEPQPPPGQTRSPLALLRGLRPADLPVLAGELLREAIQPLTVLRVRRLVRGIALADTPQRPSWRTVRLAGDDADRFTAACRGHGATVNDGLLAAIARLTADRGERGPVAAGFTLDLRRFLPEPRALVGNQHAAALLVLRRDRLADASAAIRAVSDATSERKRRLYGLAYAVLPTVTLGWWPHALLRIAGGRVIANVLSYLDRGLVVTNIGALDEVLAPFGDDALDAWIVGPFVRELRVPVVVATGFRGRYTLQVCADHPVTPAAADALAADLRGALADQSTRVPDR